MNNDQSQPALNQPVPKPVAYDAEGQPLYAAPPPPDTPPPVDSHVHSAPESHEGHNYDPKMRVQYANEPRVVHHTRQHEPEVSPISEDLKRKHDASLEKYPNLNLSDGEYVVKSLKRHPVGLIIPIALTALSILVLLAALITYPLVAAAADGSVPWLGHITVVMLCLIALVGIGGYAATWVYIRNTFYLTNESVIQEIQHSVFSKHEQTVSLGSIEDASFRQVGIMQMALNYGSIRLSTEGDETTYHFEYVDNPKKQIAILNNAIEAFKNGRPITDVYDD